MATSWRNAMTDEIFNKLDKKIETICDDIAKKPLPPRVAFQKHGFPLAVIDFILKKGENSAAVAVLIEMREMQLLTEDEYNDQISSYTDAEDPLTVIDERAARIWRSVMMAGGQMIERGMAQFVAEKAGATGGKELLEVASTMFSKSRGDPLFAPSTEYSSDTSATARDILTYLNSIGNTARERDANTTFTIRTVDDDAQGTLFDVAP